MDPLPPIPTPPSLRWREFRIALLPLITFTMTLVAIVWMWGRYVHPASILGEVEVARATVITTLAGTVSEVRVARFQRVTNGQVLAIISGINEDALKAELSAIEADLKVTRARMELDILRNRDSFESLRLDYLKEKVELALDQVSLRFAHSAFQRADELIRTTPRPLISTNDYETLQRDYEVIRATVAQREAYLVQKSNVLERLNPWKDESRIVDDPIAKAITAQQELIRQSVEMQTLRSPLDGMVSSVSVYPGLKVTPGLPLFTVSGGQAQRIVGWLRQPVMARPAPGDKVAVRRHSFQLEVEEVEVEHVGTQLEPITPSLLVGQGSPTSSNPNLAELGLPFSIKLPTKLNLIPGEAVEIELLPRVRQ